MDGGAPLVMAALRNRLPARSVMQSERLRACTCPRTPLKLLEGRPTKEVIFLASPLVLYLLEKARALDAVLRTHRPLRRRPPVRDGSGPPAGVAGLAGRGGTGPRAVGGNRQLLTMSPTAPDRVREYFVRSLWPPRFADLSAFGWLRRCRLLICHFASFEPLKAAALPHTRGQCRFEYPPSFPRPCASGVLARDVGGGA